MAGQDYYSVLGISPNATTEEVRKAFAIRSRVCHPDRFDRRTQEAEWDLANEMLKELNAAYQCLRDPKARARYDAELLATRSGGGSASPPPFTRQEPEEDPRKPKKIRIARPRAGEVIWNRRTEPARARLMADLGTESDAVESFEIPTGVRSELRMAFPLAVFIVLFLVRVFGFPTGEPQVVWAVLFGLSGVWIVRQYFLERIRWKGRLVLTPLYLFHLLPDRAQFWPLWDVSTPKKESTQLEPETRRGLLAVQIPTSTRSWKVSLKKKDVARLKESIKVKTEKLKQAESPLDGRFFLTWDYFVGVPTDRPVDPCFGRFGSWVFGGILPFAAGAVLALQLPATDLFAAHPTQQHLPRTYSPPRFVITPAIEFPEAGPLPTPLVLSEPKPPHPEPRPSAENAADPPKPSLEDAVIQAAVKALSGSDADRPPSGEMRSFSPDAHLAPLHIKTEAGGDYLLRLIEHDTDRLMGTVFVRGGDNASLKVPLGIFDIQVITGPAWQGYQMLFGRDTRIRQFAEPFYFSRTGQGYEGHSISLVPSQASGGAVIQPMHDISASDAQ